MHPTLEAYAELQLAYDTFNRLLFEGELPSCLLTLQREKRTCGYFSARRFGNIKGQVTDEIALNPAYFATAPLLETMGTIVHEMAHLWQEHFGKPGRGRYHNEEWASKMESIGLMPSDTGQPGGKRTGDQMADYPIAGGRFLKACESLLTADFRISWYDLIAIASAGVQATHLAAAQGLPPAALAIAAHTGLQLASQAVSGSGSSPLAGNRSNRSKYSCECGNNVWGKPRLAIRCETCLSVFMEHQPDLAEVSARTRVHSLTPASAGIVVVGGPAIRPSNVQSGGVGTDIRQQLGSDPGRLRPPVLGTVAARREGAEVRAPRRARR